MRDSCRFPVRIPHSVRTIRRSLGDRTSTRTQEREHLRHLVCTSAASSTLIRLHQSIDGDPLVLHGAVEHVDLSFDGTLEDGQRHGRHREALLDHDVGLVEVSSHDERPLHRRTVPTPRSGDGCRRRPCGHETVLAGFGRGDNAVARQSECPQGRCSGHAQVDARRTVQVPRPRQSAVSVPTSETDPALCGRTRGRCLKIS